MALTLASSKAKVKAAVEAAYGVAPSSTNSDKFHTMMATLINDILLNDLEILPGSLIDAEARAITGKGETS